MKASCIVWLVDVAMAFSFEAVCSFLSGEVEHHQFTDNSAARQLISRQGVGRIRHLSGKLLWMQSKVMDGSVVIHQVPTLWNFSDVGTKSLPRARLLFFYFVGLVWLMRQQQNLWEWMSTTM